MTNNVSSNIALLGLYVEHIEYDFDAGTEPLQDLGDLDIEIAAEILDRDPIGHVRLSVSCSHDPAISWGHRVKARLVATYEKKAESDKLPFEQFLKVNAPAMLFAFARELVYSLTSRSPLPPVLLNPTDMFRLLNEGMLNYKQKQPGAQTHISQ